MKVIQKSLGKFILGAYRLMEKIVIDAIKEAVIELVEREEKKEERTEVREGQN